MATELPSGNPRRALVLSDALSLGWLHVAGARRTGAWVTLVVIEAVVALVLAGGVTLLFQEFYARFIVFWAMASSLAFALIVWPQRSKLGVGWRAAQSEHDPWMFLRSNLALFAGFIALSILVRYLEGTAAYWIWIASLVILAMAFAALSRVDVPLVTSLQAVRANGINALLAGCAGLFAVLLAKFAQFGWEPMAGATLDLTHAILSSYEADVTVRHADYYIRVGTFEVVVEKTCSGYEGIGLVSAYLAIFITVFRKSLRFPHAFLLFPLGIGIVWVVNSLRIAALISIGAHFSPQIATGGFHSQAGWIAFLAVSIGLMAFALTSRFFTMKVEHGAAPIVTTRTVHSNPRLEASEENNTVMLAHLVPLMALLASNIIIASAQPHGHPLYILKVAAIGGTLWFFRKKLTGLWQGITLEATAAGFVVGALWIATAQVPSADPPLAAWLSGQQIGFAIFWLTLRALGTIVLVPVAEELAFRGFLYRWIISRNYQNVSYSAFSWLALIVSSILFGLMHERYGSAGLAGMVFALVMVRSNQLGSAIYAHALANAIIFIWAIAAADFALL